MERRFYKLVKATVDCELFNEVKMLDISKHFIIFFSFKHLTDFQPRFCFRRYDNEDSEREN